MTTTTHCRSLECCETGDADGCACACVGCNPNAVSIPPAPDNVLPIQSGHNYCWGVTLSDDPRRMHIELWVQAWRLSPSDRGQWSCVAGTGFSLDLASATKLLPILQAFLASAPEIP
jgi:hypothetical protein